MDATKLLRTPSIKGLLHFNRLFFSREWLSIIWCRKDWFLSGKTSFKMPYHCLIRMLKKSISNEFSWSNSKVYPSHVQTGYFPPHVEHLNQVDSQCSICSKGRKCVLYVLKLHPHLIGQMVNFAKTKQNKSDEIFQNINHQSTIWC